MPYGHYIVRYLLWTFVVIPAILLMFIVQCVGKLFGREELHNDILNYFFAHDSEV